MLHSLPDSVKGCLLEAARLCGAAAGLAQENVLHSWAAQVQKVLHPLRVLLPFLAGSQMSSLPKGQA